MSALDLDAKISEGFRARLEAQRKTFRNDRQREYRHRFCVLGYSLLMREGHYDWYKLPSTKLEEDRCVEDPTGWYRKHRIPPEVKKGMRRTGRLHDLGGIHK